MKNLYRLCSVVIQLQSTEVATALEKSLSGIGFKIVTNSNFRKRCILITDTPQEQSYELDAVIGIGLAQKDADVVLSEEVTVGDLVSICKLQAKLMIEQSRVTKLKDRKAIWKKNALTDHLTRIPNRPAWERSGRKLLTQAIGHHLTVSLAMVDVQGLKEVNEQHGHHAGDLLLRYLAKVMKVVFLKTGFIARLGGDEFGVLSTTLSKDQLLKTLEDVQNKLRESVRDEIPGHAAIHRGVIEHTCLDSDKVDMLFASLELRADEQLRKVKSLRFETPA